VEAEKARVYAPIKRHDGMEWKELNAGVAKIMQHYCGDTKDDERLKIGLKWLDEMSQADAHNLCARNPHELMRTLDSLSLITLCQAIMHQCLARKSTNPWLLFNRLDYPEVNLPEWHKWITIKQENDEVKVGDLPIDYWGDLVENYEKHCGL
jgi:succinate dehydrogenase/fumarate reductase flavoprotein subunit